MIVRDINVSIIYSTTNIFEGSRRAIILLLRYYIETNNEKDMKYLYIFMIELKKSVLEKLSTFSYSLYYKFISTIEMHVMVNQKFTNQNDCLV